ncbi:hypothetical protein RU98_GL002238 [Enterococcus caccae]|nr:hypothetical protein RU98_GL002238 [Enterococcus caccae]
MKSFIEGVLLWGIILVLSLGSFILLAYLLSQNGVQKSSIKIGNFLNCFGFQFVLLFMSFI